VVGFTSIFLTKKLTVCSYEYLPCLEAWIEYVITVTYLKPTIWSVFGQYWSVVGFK